MDKHLRRVRNQTITTIILADLENEMIPNISFAKTIFFLIRLLTL